MNSAHLTRFGELMKECVCERVLSKPSGVECLFPLSSGLVSGAESDSQDRQPNWPDKDIFWL